MKSEMDGKRRQGCRKYLWVSSTKSGWAGCWCHAMSDNAKAESFIKTLKQEQVHGRDWRDLDALRAELTTFFEITYNHQRLHSALDYQTPAAFEQQLRSVANVEASTGMTGARELTAPSPQTPLPGLQSFSKENCR